jgi:phosphoribosylanthranilate isomerase
MKIKVCGNKSVGQMQQLQALGVDYAGMIFYKGSKRYAGDELHNEQALIRDLTIRKVGVFVNAEYETILHAIRDYDLYAVQLHGDETDEICLELMDKVKVIKVFRIGDQQDIDELTTPFERVCHYFLFDTDTASFGGSGKQFDWKVVETAKINKPFFLSGGIGLEDAEKLKTFHHPFFYGVDINSRFETAPGMKDLQQVEQFINTMNHG